MEVIYTRHITLREGAGIAIVVIASTKGQAGTGGGVLQIGRLCLFSLDVRE
jgi:hypothetical protein